MFRAAAILIVFLFAQALHAQDVSHIYVLHDSVGESIDRAEKVKYHLFTFWNDTAFDHAEFVMQSDSSIVLVATMTNGTVAEKTCTKENLQHYNFLVRYYAGLIPENNTSDFGKFFGGAVMSIGSTIVAYIEARRGRR